MNSDVLRYVVTVAQERSFTRAAQQLYISQPTLSQRIQALENNLGVQLFDRKTNPVSLTYAGKLYVAWAQDALLSESQIRRNLSAVVSEGKSHLYIGISPHRSTFMLPYITAKMSQEFPDCQLHIVERYVSDLNQRMEKKELDLMVNDVAPDTVRYQSVFINSERILLAVPSSYQVEGFSQKDGDDFPSINLLHVRDKPFITLSPNSYMGHSVRTLCEMEEFSPTYGFECDRVELAQMMVSRGLGITLLPELFVKLGPPVPNIDYFCIAKSDPRRDVCIIYQKETCLTEPAVHFIELMQEQFGQH